MKRNIRRSFRRVIARVSGVFVALDMPDPREDWRRMAAEILCTITVFGVTILIIFLLATAQGVFR